VYEALAKGVRRQNHDLAVHCTREDRDVAFFRRKTVVAPCGLLQNLFQHYLSLPDVETNTMVCRMAENVVEKLSVEQIFAG
jgi:hypothetical protein